MRLILRDLCGEMRWGLKLRDSPGIVHGPRFNAGIKRVKGLHFFIKIFGLTRTLDSVPRDGHACSLRSHRIACSLPLLAPCFASCLLLYPLHPLTLGGSRQHDDPLMHVITGTAQATGAIHSPGLSSLPKGHCYPLRSSPSGEALIMMDALGANSI